MIASQNNVILKQIGFFFVFLYLSWSLLEFLLLVVEGVGGGGEVIGLDFCFFLLYGYGCQECMPRSRFFFSF